MMRELRSTYARVPGGILWAYLEPIFTVALLSFGFALILRSPPLGRSFALFFASGYGVFLLFQTTAATLGNGFLHLKRKGRRHWPEAILARLAIGTTLALSVALSLGGGVAWSTGVPGLVDLWGIVEALALALGAGIAVGFMNCALFAILPVWRPLWAVMSRMLFLISGVLFLPRDLPSTVQWLLEWNPLIHILSLLRESLYHGYAPLYQDSFFVALSCLLCSTCGIALTVLCHPVPRAARRRMSA